MGDLEIQDAFGIIERARNPEIHHYNHGSHPGLRWFIKTILPDRDTALDACRDLVDAWQGFARRNHDRVRIVPVAYHWNGEIMPGWHTIWLDNSIDVAWRATTDAMSFEIIEHDLGMRASCEKIREILAHGHGGSFWLDKLEEVTGMLGSYASRDHINRKRSTIRVL